MRRALAALALLGPTLAAEPSAAACVLDAIRGADRFSTLARMADAAGIGGCFPEEASGTFFAPTDAAFDRLKDGVIDQITEPEMTDELEILIEHHLAPGLRLTREELQGGTRRVEMAEAEPLLVGPVEDAVRIGDATVVEFDILPETGALVHAIDAVLVPELVWNILERDG